MATVIESLVVELRGKLTNFEKDMSSATSTLQKTNSNVQRISNQISNAVKIGIGVVSVTAVKSLVGSLADLAEKGEVAGSIQDSFERLGGSSAAIDRASEASLGLVSKFDLMSIANKQLLAELPNVNENFGLIADVGTRLADTLGIDTKDAIEKLNFAIIKGNKGQLERFGFNLEGIKGKSEITAEALRQLTDVQNNLAPSGQSLANVIDGLKVSWNDFTAEIGIVLNNNLTLQNGLLSLKDVILNLDLKTIIGSFGMLSEVVATAISWFDKVTTFIADVLAGALYNAGLKLDEFRTAWTNLGVVFNDVLQKITVAWNSFVEYLALNIGKVKSSIIGMANTFGEVYAKITGDSYVPYVDQQVTALDNFKISWTQLDTTVTESSNKIKTDVTTLATSVKTNSQKMINANTNVSNSFKKMKKDTKKEKDDFDKIMEEDTTEYFNKLEDDLASGIYDTTNTVTDGFEKMSKKGVTTVGGFVETIIGMLGKGGSLQSGVSGGGGIFGDLTGNNSGSLGLGNIFAGGGAGAAGGNALGQDPLLMTMDIALGLPPGTTQLLSGMLGIDVNKELDRLTKNIGNTVSDAFEDVGDFFGFAKGGVVAGPTIGIVGEAGPEAMLPLTKKNGVLGVNASGYTGGSGSVTYNIDARGSSAGVERNILNALRKMQTNTIDSTMSQQQDMIDRGFSYGY